jgi:hypothetical protein
MGIVSRNETTSSVVLVQGKIITKQNIFPPLDNRKIKQLVHLKEKKTCCSILFQRGRLSIAVDPGNA